MEKKIPTVAIVGRPNVGKSSLFNAILKRRAAIVHSESGVTRDRINAVCEFRRKRFQLIDTGGLSLYEGESAKDLWSKEIRRQVEIAIESSDKIIFVVEAGEPLPLDFDIAAKLRASGKKIIVAVNKSDNQQSALTAANFARLGFGDIFPVSSVHRIGIDDLLNAVTEDFPEIIIEEEEALRIAVAGRPNVGKSSLVNMILGSERMLVSEIPGTTRDAVQSEIIIKEGEENIKIVFVDTAGLRQKRKADSPVEIFSINRTEKAILSSDIVIFMLDASSGEPSAQDKKIGAMIREAGKGCIIAANKMDLCKKTFLRDIKESIRNSLPFLSYAPVLLISALRGTGREKIISSIFELRNSGIEKPPTAVVNKILENAQAMNPAPRNFKIYYATYTGGKPPSFLLFCNKPSLCPANYLAFIENSLREKFPFKGYPIQLRLRARKQR